MTRLAVEYSSTSPDDALEFVWDKVHRKIRGKKKYAAVFDIDDTALLQKKNSSDRYGVYPSVFALYQRLLLSGVELFFITARYEDYTEGTIQELHNHGFLQWKYLYLRRISTENEPDFASYKRLAREDIRKQGYTILVNCGDQWRDLLPENEIPARSEQRFYVFESPYEPGLWNVKFPSREQEGKGTTRRRPASA